MKASDNVFPKLIYAEGAAPATPAANTVVQYAKSDGKLYSKNDAGVETALGGGSGDVVGPASSVADRIAVFDGATGKLLKDGGSTIAALSAPKIVTTISSGTITPADDTDLVRPAALTAALTIANPSGTLADGAGFVVDLIDNGTSRALTWGSKYANRMSTLPTTTTVSKRHRIGFEYNAADDKLYCMYAQVQP